MNACSVLIRCPAYPIAVLPFAEGPMVLAGFAWYQGEANTANTTTAAQYGCLFPEMIRAWRAAFAAPGAFFGFIQLSTWYGGSWRCRCRHACRL